MRCVRLLFTWAGVFLFTGVLSAGVAPTLGEAGRFAVLSLNDTEVVFSRIAAEVYGDVGVAAGGCLALEKGGVYGDMYLDAAAMCDPWPFPGTATHLGEIFYDQDLSEAAADAFAAAQAAAAATGFKQTFAAINASQTITGRGTGELNVIDIDTLDLGNREVLTLAGTADDIFILNVSSLRLGHRTSKIIGSGVDASQILLNVVGSASTLKGEINGTILAVGKSISLQCLLNGAVIAGTVDVGQVEIGTTVHGVTFVPEPSTMAILGLGGLCLARRRTLG